MNCTTTSMVSQFSSIHEYIRELNEDRVFTNARLAVLRAAFLGETQSRRDEVWVAGSWRRGWFSN
jgi:hypothetical protein